MKTGYVVELFIDHTGSNMDFIVDKKELADEIIEIIDEINEAYNMGDDYTDSNLYDDFQDVMYEYSNPYDLIHSKENREQYDELIIVNDEVITVCY